MILLILVISCESDESGESPGSGESGDSVEFGISRCFYIFCKFGISLQIWTIFTNLGNFFLRILTFFMI